MSVPVDLIRGDTLERSDKIYGDDMGPMPLHGVSVWLTVKPQVDDDITDSAAVIGFVLDVDADGNATGNTEGMTIGGIDPTTEAETSDPADGVYTVFVPWEISTELEARSYVYDVQVATAHNPRRVRTVIENAPWVVRGDITRRMTTNVLPEEE